MSYTVRIAIWINCLLRFMHIRLNGAIADAIPTSPKYFVQRPRGGSFLYLIVDPDVLWGLFVNATVLAATCVLN